MRKIHKPGLGADDAKDGQECVRDEKYGLFTRGHHHSRHFRPGGPERPRRLHGRRGGRNRTGARTGRNNESKEMNIIYFIRFLLFNISSIFLGVYQIKPHYKFYQ